MNLGESYGIDAFLIESCPAVVQALYFLSLKLTLSAYQTEMTCIRRLDIFHFRLFHRGKCKQTTKYNHENFLFLFKTFIFLVRGPDKSVRRAGTDPLAVVWKALTYRADSRELHGQTLAYTLTSEIE
jgi:hypothetical protein